MSPPRTRQTSTNSPSVSVETSDETLWKKLELRLNKQSKQIKTLIEDSSKELSRKIDQALGNLNNRFSQIDKIIASMTERIESLEEQHNNIPLGVNHEDPNLHVLMDKIDLLERESVSADVVLNGVPKKSDEDLHDLMHELCTSLNCTPTPVLKDIFRTRAKGSSADTSIIIKLGSKKDKNVLLHSISQRYKTSKKSLCLRDINMNSDKRIYLNESLTTHNHMIFREAYHLKRQKKVSSVFTRNGQVYVRPTPQSDTVLITSHDLLKKTIASYERDLDDNRSTGDGTGTDNDNDESSQHLA